MFYKIYEYIFGLSNEENSNEENSNEEGQDLKKCKNIKEAQLYYFKDRNERIKKGKMRMYDPKQKKFFLTDKLDDENRKNINNAIRLFKNSNCESFREIFNK